MGLCKILTGAIILLAPIIVTWYIPEPYMDEFFHVRQTLQYIETLNFRDWDPKITTPPGLYGLAFVVCQFLNNESLLLLRYINSIPVFLALLVGRRSLVISSFPLLVFFSALFYTDVWSTLLVIASLSTCNVWYSALFGLLSLTFRQTNIIWCMFAAVNFLIPENATINYVFHDLTHCRRLLSNRRKIFEVIVAFGSIGLAFAAFLVYNGGITLGDKSNHAFSLHFAQLLYYLLFLALFSFPLALLALPTVAKRYTRNWSKELWRTPLEFLAIYAIIKYGTIVHPFILADNRHYTFYIHRRFISKGLLMLPVYWGCYRWFASTIKFKDMRTIAYLLCVVAVLVPSPLMEPRYYMVPYLVWRVFVYGGRGRIVEYLWNTLISVVTIGVFCVSETHFMY